MHRMKMMYFWPKASNQVMPKSSGFLRKLNYTEARTTARPTWTSIASIHFRQNQHSINQVNHLWVRRSWRCSQKARRRCNMDRLDTGAKYKIHVQRYQLRKKAWDIQSKWRKHNSLNVHQSCSKSKKYHRKFKITKFRKARNQFSTKTSKTINQL